MAIPPFSIEDIMVDFSYLIGEQSTPTSGIEDRKAFAQRTLEEIHRYADWEWAKSTTTVQLTAGIGTLPVDCQISPSLDIRLIQAGLGSDHIFTAIPYEAQDNYGDGDYRYWLTGTVGSYTLNTSEHSDSTSLLTVRYDTVPANLLAAESTKFPSSLTIAQGALRYYRAARDPEYDVSQDDAIFQRGLNNVWADQNSAAPLVRAQTAQDRAGTSIGDIG